jgi:uncharacterized protein YcfL
MMKRTTVLLCSAWLLTACASPSRVAVPDMLKPKQIGELTVEKFLQMPH